MLRNNTTWQLQGIEIWGKPSNKASCGILLYILLHPWCKMSHSMYFLPSTPDTLSSITFSSILFKQRCELHHISLYYHVQVPANSAARREDICLRRRAGVSLSVGLCANAFVLFVHCAPLVFVNLYLCFVLSTLSHDFSHTHTDKSNTLELQSDVIVTGVLPLWRHDPHSGSSTQTLYIVCLYILV